MNLRKLTAKPIWMNWKSSEMKSAQDQFNARKSKSVGHLQTFLNFRISQLNLLHCHKFWMI